MSVYVRVFACVVCLCVCVLSSWHSSTNLSSIQIFHSDGKRPDSNSIVPWKVHFHLSTSNKICHVLKGQMPGLVGPSNDFTCQIVSTSLQGGGVSRNNDRSVYGTVSAPPLKLEGRGPTTAFGLVAVVSYPDPTVRNDETRVVGRQAYTKICAKQLCNICCEYHYIIYTHVRDNCVVYHHRTKMAEAATSQGYVLL